MLGKFEKIYLKIEKKFKTIWDDFAKNIRKFS